jgi:hypothetical protein
MEEKANQIKQEENEIRRLRNKLEAEIKVTLLMIESLKMKGSV